MSTEVTGKLKKMKVNLVGMVFNRLTVISIHERIPGKHIKYKCKCVCGNESAVAGTNLLTGTTKSCGCHKREVTIKNKTKDFDKVVFPKGNHLNTGISKEEYLSIHAWIRHHHGRPSMCELCRRSDKKRYEWALRKGEKYNRDIKSYIRLCKGCHNKYDVTEQSRANMSNAHIGIKNTHRHVPVIQYSIDMAIINEHESISSASAMTGALKSAISNNLSGRSKSAAGFIWKHKNKL
jgi:hypothetical protein